MLWEVEVQYRRLRPTRQAIEAWVLPLLDGLPYGHFHVLATTLAAHGVRHLRDWRARIGPGRIVDLFRNWRISAC